MTVLNSSNGFNNTFYYDIYDMKGVKFSKNRCKIEIFLYFGVFYEPPNGYKGLLWAKDDYL